MKPVATSRIMPLKKADRIEAARMPIGEARARPPVGDRKGDPGHHQAHDVAEIVPGVGEQRQRIGLEAIDHLRRDQRDIERGRDREGAAEIRRHVRMAVAVMSLRVGAADAIR